MARGRPTARWVTLALLMMVAAWALYRLFDELAQMGPELDLNQLLLPALSFAR